MHSLEAQADAIAAAYIPPLTGRPSDIADATLLKELFSAIEDGNYLETACDLVGLSVVTVNTWKKRGEDGEAPFDRFLIALKAASSRAEARAVANVRQAGKLPQFWAAEMTYLERRHPEKWGRRQEGDSGPKVVVQIGVSAGQVQGLAISVSPPTFAPDSPLEDSANSLTGNAFALPSSPIIKNYVNQPDDVPSVERVTVSNEAHRQFPAVESPKGPRWVAAAAGVPSGVSRGQRRRHFSAGLKKG